MSKLTLATRIIYDLTVNTDAQDGLFNGAECTLKYIDYQQPNGHPRLNINLPCILWVNYHENNVGLNQRQKYKQWYNDRIDPLWTPVFLHTRTFNYNKRSIQRRQFPLKPSAAKTVHRSQGHTLDKVVIDSGKRRICHMHYTALSRARRLSDIQLLYFDETKITVSEEVIKEMERLRANKILSLSYTPVSYTHLTLPTKA